VAASLALMQRALLWQTKMMLLELLLLPRCFRFDHGRPLRQEQ
jgi:hypothetical protein